MDDTEERLTVRPETGRDLPVGVEHGVVPGKPPGALQSILGVFVHPRRTFESMRDRPHFRLALALMLVIQTGIALALFHSGVIAEQTIAKMEEQGKDPRQIEAVSNFFEGTGGLVTTVVTAPFATAVGVLCGAALLFFMANLMMGARLRFAHYLSAAVYAGIVQMVDQLVRVSLILVNRTFDVRLGLGVLFGDATGFPIRALDILTDPLFLWGNAVCAIGVSAYSRRSFKFGVLAVIPGMLLAVILTANR
jgi:hypothetical protein